MRPVLTFFQRLERNSIRFGVPWFLVGLILSWPRSWLTLVVQGMLQVPGTVIAVLIFTALEHWYGALREARDHSTSQK